MGVRGIRPICQNSHRQIYRETQRDMAVYMYMCICAYARLCVCVYLREIRVSDIYIEREIREREWVGGAGSGSGLRVRERVGGTEAIGDSCSCVELTHK